MELGLNGRAALVTGASRGIGFAVASELAREGCDVTLVARQQAPLSDAAARLADETGRRISTHAVDLAARWAADAAVDGHLTDHGRLDILVNNAGAAQSGDFFALTDDAWETSFALKFHGYVRMCRAAFPALEASGTGVVINNVGAAARQPKPGFLIGASINAALNNLTKGLAEIGLQKGVRVVSMNSGPVRTARLEATLRRLAEDSGEDLETVAVTRAREVFGMRRYAEPEDLGKLAAFLASDHARHIHGSNIFIDGGQTKEV